MKAREDKVVNRLKEKLWPKKYGIPLNKKINDKENVKKYKRKRQS